MKIALVQQAASRNIEKNIQEGLNAVKIAAAKGANIICFPELAFTPFYPAKPAPPDYLQLAEPIPGKTTEAFSSLAAELNVVIILNLFERVGNKAFDSSPVINSDGTILGITRMLHITDYECFYEKSYYSPGDTGVKVYQTNFGKIGVAICYDRHYPEYMRALALAGAEIVFIPQAGAVGEWPDGIYRAEVQTAAFQNGYFAALCNRTGKEDCLEFEGGSFICSPEGKILSAAGKSTQEILIEEIDLNMIKNSSAKKLFFRDRRQELYKEWFR